MALLILKSGSKVVREIPMLRTIMTVGRLPANDVVIDDPTISGYHARLLFEDGQYFVHDLNSLNGTFVGSARVRRTSIKDGDEIRIGRQCLVFKASMARPAEVTEITVRIQPSAEDVTAKPGRDRS